LFVALIEADILAAAHQNTRRHL